MKIHLKNERGYFGSFTRRTAYGAYHNGSIVKKINSEPGDTRADGERGIVLGSMFEPSVSPDIMYFIEWNSAPKTAVAVISWKLIKVR